MLYLLSDCIHIRIYFPSALRQHEIVGTMSMRSQNAAMRGGDRRDTLDDSMMADDNLSDDDNAQLDVEEPEMDNEDPLLLAFDDLEGRVVAAIDDVKRHSGLATDLSPGAPSIYEELTALLRPVLEVAAHTGPSVARTYYKGTGPEGIEASVEDAYEKTVSDLVLPFMLEMAQSDMIPAKRCASLEFFRTLYKECHKVGSWLDVTTVGLQAGPYGPGGSHHSAAGVTPAIRVITKRRHQKRLIREGELLRYWIESALANVAADNNADDDGNGASRAIIAASAAIRPSLRHISQRIRDADDRGAARLYSPVMKMVEAVLRKFMSSHCGELERSACIKFLEIVILCCSQKPPQHDATKRKGPVVVSITWYSSRRWDTMWAPLITARFVPRYPRTFHWRTYQQGILALHENLLNPLPNTRSRPCVA
jgi:symplekin